MERLGERLLGVRDNDVEGLDGLILESGRKAVVGEALSADDRHALALSCDCIAAELGAAALHELGDIDIEGVRALVDEGEAEILLTRLELFVLLDGIACFFSHFLRRQSEVFAEVRDTLCDLFYPDLCIL